MEIKFWGVRGSIPSPLSPAQVQRKVAEAIRLTKEGRAIPFEVESTFGGNTTCVEINIANQLFICDMGTGVRELGKVQAARLVSEKRAAPLERPKLHGTILQSHVHWDHIQGFPFWAPLFFPRMGFDCKFDFFGGKKWDSELDLVYRGQMSPPEFPVNLEELEQIAMHLQFQTIWDRWTKTYNENQGDEPLIKVTARKLFHPQETFGYRFECGGKSVAFTTDHEPHDPSVVPLPLLELVQGVDVWMTDCQYSHAEYSGKGGPQKMGWGHSFPEYLAVVAKEAKPKKIITTHHDPDSDDYRVGDLALSLQELAQVDTVPAYEGLEVTV